jgi:adenylate cyclase
MTPPPLFRVILRHSLLLFLGVAMILSLEYVGMFEGADNYLHDLSFRVRGTVVANNDIIIVAIDEQTLEKLGRWPLNRRHYATLLDRTREARVVAFDIIMAEPTHDDIVHPAGIA